MRGLFLYFSERKINSWFYKNVFFVLRQLYKIPERSMFFYLWKLFIFADQILSIEIF